MKAKPAPRLIESKPIVVVDMRERITGMSEGDLNTLHQNATRLARSGSERQRASAHALMPAIEAELTARHEKLPAATRSRRIAREIAANELNDAPATATAEPETVPIALEPTIAAHKFALGGLVKLSRTLVGLPMDGLVYEVVRQLPTERNELQYRIRTRDGRVERIVLETQLRGAHPSDVDVANAAMARPRVR